MIWKKSTDGAREPMPEPRASQARLPAEPAWFGEAPEVLPAPGASVALLGLPDSGKSSFLHSLGRRASRSRSLRWLWPFPGREHAANTGKPNERLDATARGTFRVISWGRVRRPWLVPVPVEVPEDHGKSSSTHGASMLMPMPSRGFTIPEISGENVELFADGQEARSDSDRLVAERLGEYLANCDELVFLAGLKSSRVGQRMTQDTVESAIARAVRAIGNILEHMGDGRGDRSRGPIFVSFLITKRDALKDFAGLDSVAVDSEASSVGMLIRDGSRPWLAGLVSEDAGRVRFSVNALCDHRKAASDLDLQEAAAVDFLRCHAPKAASDLASLCARPGISLRTFTCKPFGYECKTAAGASAYPSEDRLDPSMCWEPLDDLIERRFRWHARRRLRDWGFAAAALLALVVALGPVLAATCHGRARIAAAARDTDAATAWLRVDDFNPWSGLLRLSSEAHRLADAERWWQVRSAAVDGGVDPNSAQVEALDEEVDRRDPGGALARSAILDRRVRGVVASLDPAGAPSNVVAWLDEPGSRIVLPPRSAVELLNAVMGVRTNVSPASLSRSKPQWDEIGSGLARLRNWFAPSDGTAARVAVSGEDPALSRRILDEIDLSIGAARVRSGLAGAERASELRPLALAAARADDAVGLRLADDRLVRLLREQWDRSVPRDTLRAPKVPAFVAGAPAPMDWPLADERLAAFAGSDLRSWESSIGPYLLTDPSAVELQAFCRDAQRAFGTSDAIRLDGEDRPARVIRALESIAALAGAEAALSAERARLRDRLEAADPEVIRGAAQALDVGVVEDVDLGSGAGAFRLPLRSAASSRAQSVRELLAALLALYLESERFPDQTVLGSAASIAEALSTRGVDLPARSIAQLEIGRQLMSANPDASAVARAFARLVETPGGVPEPVRAALAGSATSVGTLLPAALEGISSAATVPAAERIRVAGAIVAGVRSWGAFDRPAAKATVDALCGLGADPLLAATPAIRQLLDRAKESIGEEDRFDATLTAMMAWVDGVQRCAAAPRDAGFRALGPILADFESDLRSSFEPGVAERTIRSLVVRGVTDVDGRLGRMVGELDAHRALARKWGLVPVFGDDEFRCYLSPREWSTEDLRKLDLKDCPVTVGFNSKGELTNDVARNKNLGTWLGVRSRADAEWLAGRAGLRLPTAREREYAWAQLQPLPAQGKLPESTAWTFERLAELGDRTVGPAGSIVGLRWGVREWCSDGPAEPAGGSSLFPAGAPEKDRRDEVGVRPALDAVPAAVAEALGSRRG